MNIGIFSGSFNPIHIGHLILANYITEFTELDEVWFLVSPHNPLKERSELTGQNERLKMVELATKGYAKLNASDFEFTLPKPSYTINTLEELNKVYPQHLFTLIIGADNWKIFHQWKDYEHIINNYNIVVYPRLNNNIEIPEKYSAKVKELNAPVIEISSTFIREAITEGKEIKAFLPENVYSYIKENNLYK